MIKSICLVSSIILMSGCLYDDDDATTTVASQTTVVAKAPSSVGNSGLPGKTISFNPTLVFNLDGVTIDYSNSSTDGSYPTGDFANLTISEQVEGERLVISITVNSEKIDLGFSFTDRGGEGFIDEAVLDLVEVNDEVKELPAKVTVAIDAGTVRNENVKTEDLPDLSGAPTRDEWNNYIIGTGLLTKDNSGVGDISIIQFTSSTEGVKYSLSGSDAGTADTATYVYTKVDATEGNLALSDTYVLNFPGHAWHQKQVKDDWEVKLTWSDAADATFYNGNWSDKPNSGTITNLETNEKMDYESFYGADNSLSYGTFGAISNVSIYIQQNTQNIASSN